MDHNVLKVQTVAVARFLLAPSYVLIPILTRDDATEDLNADTHSGSLLHFHQRLGNSRYDTVERMAMDPASGIVLTDRKQPTCISCAQGK